MSEIEQFKLQMIFSINNLIQDRLLQLEEVVFNGREQYPDYKTNLKLIQDLEARLAEQINRNLELEKRAVECNLQRWIAKGEHLINNPDKAYSLEDWVKQKSINDMSLKVGKPIVKAKHSISPRTKKKKPVKSKKLVTKKVKAKKGNKK